MNLNTAMIQVEAISFAYAQADPLKPPIFQNFNWQIGRGEAWAILGPSGCGKTTFLYLLAGLLFPSAGRILIDSQPLTRPRPRSGLILQEYGLLPWATVRQNVEIGWRIRTFYGPDGKHAPSDPLPTASVEHWFERLGLTAVCDQYPGQISGGQRQRTAIARTLVLQPDLLLMDEPFSSLDAPTRTDLQNLTLELLTEQQLTLIIVTHSIEEAATLGQNILLLNQPPNEHTGIISNPGAIRPGHRDTQDYLYLCRELRQRMGRV